MRPLTAALLLGLSLVGCYTDPVRSAIPVEIGPVIVNVPDTFEVVPLGLVSDGSREFLWHCSAPQANVTVAGMTDGAIRIEIWDADDWSMHDNWYEGGLMGAIDTVTAPDGHPGTWTIRLTFEHVLSMGSVTIGADTWNAPDEIVLAGMYDLNSTYSFDVGWPGGPAHCDIASGISAGIVRVRMWDGAGNLVMDKSNLALFVGILNGDSLPGVGGVWHVELDVNAVAVGGAVSLFHW